MNTPLLRVQLRRGEDVVLARRRARQTRRATWGSTSQEQIRLATAVSEVCRNAVEYAAAVGGPRSSSTRGVSRR